MAERAMTEMAAPWTALTATTTADTVCHTLTCTMRYSL
jgi:hypothetical protein